MFYRWKTRRRKERFYRLTAGILDTSPMPVVDAPWSIVSMVSNSDVQMYLLAMKSFYSRLKRGKMTAIVDRDMPMAARQTLQHHLPGLRLAILEDIDTGPCQRGGTWERLLYVIDRSREEYAIQLDADTLTFGPIEEVIRCVENNIAYTLGNEGEPIEPMPAIVPSARAMQSNYVGVAAERLFDQYAGAEKLNYVRGSSGFCGFARGGIARPEIEAFHREGERLLGSRWTEWGTEQSASNFAIANTPGAIVLPYPKYANFDPAVKSAGTVFLHFIGSHRYLGDHFATLAQGVIAQLNAAG
ncbi:MAG TPA: hypothetical protein VHV26_12845 [Rhizomicrobium sp.]|jgi:hypothetical protein|nr:hypothetical protein [Rhizomicrobium sp.]